MVNGNKADGLFRRCDCPVCGKQFWADVVLWVYRARVKKHHEPVIVCSYGCMRKAQAEYEKLRWQGRKPKYKQNKEEAR